MAARPEAVEVPDIDRLFKPTHDERARQSMVSMLRKMAIIDLRQAVKKDYDERVAPALAAAEGPAREARPRTATWARTAGGPADKRLGDGAGPSTNRDDEAAVSLNLR